MATRRLHPTQVPQSKEVLLLVDVINPFRFPKAKDVLDEAVHVASRIARLKRRLGSKGVAAIYANDNYGTWHSEFSDILKACRALPGQRGEVAQMLAPDACDLVVLKPQHSAFHSTPLLHLLRRMEARKLVIVGFAADMCVMLTATDASMFGYEVWVPSDCTAAESQHRKENAMRQLRQAFKCSIAVSDTRAPLRCSKSD